MQGRQSSVAYLCQCLLYKINVSNLIIPEALRQGSAAIILAVGNLPAQKIKQKELSKT
jgi:hypothetical protein